MRAHILNIDSSNITILQSDIIPLLGNEYGAVDSYTEGLIDKCISSCRKCMSPQGGYIKVKALNSDSISEISIDGVNFKVGKALKKMLAGSEAYAFFLVSAGQGPESLARVLMEKGEFLEGYIVDLVASAIVESIANQVQEEIHQIAGEDGLKISNRYSPGSCNWHVSEQQKLFKLFPEHFCGITLSDSSLMSPIKSVSALMGIGKSVAYQEYTCEICPMTTCLYRKTRDSATQRTSSHS